MYFTAKKASNTTTQETLEEELYTYQKKALCRMQVSAEAAIASFHILTSPDMPKAGESMTLIPLKIFRFSTLNHGKFN